MVDTSLSVLPEFLGLLLLLMAVTLGSQLALTALRHHFVFRLRSLSSGSRTPGGASRRLARCLSLLAGLTSDVRHHHCVCPSAGLVQGIILTVGSAAYLARLSARVLAVTALWITNITIWGGFSAGSRVYKHMAVLRETEGTNSITITRRYWKA